MSERIKKNFSKVYLKGIFEEMNEGIVGELFNGIPGRILKRAPGKLSEGLN